MPKIFRVFYSWQSDSDRTTNKDFILKALEAAALTLGGSESHPDLKVYIDEATRDEAGSPNIPETILKKIAACDAFVCDVTTINPDYAGRRVPNPNAAYELGYAVAMFGWSRVILVFNEAIGKFPDDLPFDFDRHRAKNYKAIPATSKETKDALDGAKRPRSFLRGCPWRHSRHEPKGAGLESGCPAGRNQAAARSKCTQADIA